MLFAGPTAAETEADDMSTTEARRSHAVSRDGTEIGYWTSGEGPPLVLVHGTTADHTTAWDPLRPHLEPHVTVHAIDRRGRGASGDRTASAGYDVAREFEDVAAVVDEVARASGSPVDLLGHSYGGLCAFGAAGLRAHIGRLILYEGWPPANPGPMAPPPGLLDRLAALAAAGDPESVIETFLREVVKMPDLQINGFKAEPTWQNRVAAAHTIPRELRAFPASGAHAALAERVQVPTLVLVGEASPNWGGAEAATMAGKLPDARVAVLKGQSHVAHLVAPELFAEAVLGFLRDTIT
jgi:pimeloyl-ACP methyl ester carboxylesterase